MKCNVLDTYDRRCRRRPLLEFPSYMVKNVPPARYIPYPYALTPATNYWIVRDFQCTKRGAEIRPQNITILKQFVPQNNNFTQKCRTADAAPLNIDTNA